MVAVDAFSTVEGVFVAVTAQGGVTSTSGSGISSERRQRFLVNSTSHLEQCYCIHESS